MYKPFLAIPEINQVQPDNNNYTTSGILYNGYFLEIDPSIYPRTQNNLNIIYTALYRITSFLNTLEPLYVPQGKRVLRITGFTDYQNFKIESVNNIYLQNGYVHLPIIYVEKCGKPSIITK